MNQVARRKAQIDSATQTVSSLATKMSTLKNASLALSTGVGFASFVASSSDSAVVASATGAAGLGSYAVSVQALARAQKTRSATFNSSNTALGITSSLNIQVGSGDAKSVSVGANDTLSDIASKISGSGARVSASIMNDGTGYRLIVQGLETGASNAFTLTESGTEFGFAAPSSTYETASDAALTVDGMAVTSASNQVSGVIAGVKLALTKVTTSPVSVQVATDASSLKTKVSAFVSAYNDVVNSGHAAAGFGSQKASNLVLSADSAIRSSLQRLGSVVAGVAPGTSGKYTTLASVGIKLGADGTLTMDSVKFDEAMAADADAVRRIFVTDTATGADGLMKKVMAGVDGLLQGNGARLQARIDTLASQSKRLEDTRTRMETRLVAYEEQLKKQFLNMDQLISKYKTMSSAIEGSILSNTNNSNGSNGG